MKKLGDIAIVTTGKITTRIRSKGENEQRQEKTIIPSSISEGIIDHSNLGSETLKVNYDKSKLLLSKKGDIVMKLFPPYDSAIIQKADENLIITSYCALIRCQEGIKPEFILAILNNPKTINQFKRISETNSINGIRIDMIKNIKIPSIDQKEQEDIINLYQETYKEVKLLKELMTNQIMITNALISHKLQEASNDTKIR